MTIPQHICQLLDTKNWRIISHKNVRMSATLKALSVSVIAKDVDIK